MNEVDVRREMVRSARDMQRFVQAFMGPVCQRYGLTLQQFYVLMELKVEPNQTVSQLSDHAGILRTNFPQVCRKLECRNLVVRRKSETDSRSYLLNLTGEASEILAAVDRDIMDAYGVQLASEPEETYEAIIKGFSALRGLMGRFDPDASAGGV